MRDHIEWVVEMPDRIIKIDGAIKFSAKFVGRSSHVSDEYARTALRQARSCANDGTFFEVATSDLRALRLKVFKPQSWSTRWIDHATRGAAKVLPNKPVYRGADLCGWCEEGRVDGGTAVESGHGWAVPRRF